MNARYWKDLGERTASTFAAGSVAALAADWTGIVPSDWKAWIVSGALAGAVSVVKGLAAKRVGDPNTASLLPASAAPPTQ